MIRIIYLIFIITTLSYCASSLQKPVSTSDLYEPQTLPVTKSLQTIAFGSCNREDLPQDYWVAIAKQKSDLWIWLGDNIYGDTDDMEDLARQYKQQKNNPAYRAFRDDTPIIGIWDDHDYGLNDGGKEYQQKAASQQIALDFLDVSPDAPVRKREGLYQSYTFGPTGKRVKILLLDTRYFRDGLEKNLSGTSRYKINETGDILGESQWKWLEEELKNSNAQVHLIASSIQVIPVEHGFEKWSNFPKARYRLLELLEKYQPSHTLLLSGDRHLAEVSRISLPSWPQPLHELTTSGLTHSYEKANEPNQYRVGELVGLKNFGVLQIDWSGPEPSLRYRLLNMQGQAYYEIGL